MGVGYASTDTFAAKFGGRVSFTLGKLLSDIGEVRGGGGGGSRDRGWYAVLVCILRLEDVRMALLEEKGRSRSCCVC